MFKKLFSALIALILIMSGAIANFNGLNQTVQANDIYDKVYEVSNYENPFALDRIIVALKTDLDSQSSLESSGLTLMKILSTPDISTSSTVQNIVGLYSITKQTAEGVLEAIEELKSNPAVVYAEPDYIITSDKIPNDPSYTQLYGMTKISAPKAWDTYTGAKNVVVGVIDSGIDYNHPDLKNNIWTNPGEIPGNGIDDDKNGYIDDVYGWNFVSNTNNPMDDYGHGTHVAGTIGAVGNNGIGVVGVTWNTQLAALKFLDSSGGGYTSNAILAINYAAKMNFEICNNSWGGGSYSQSLRDTIASYGGVAIAAAGNNGTNNDTSPSYPASYNCSNIISVAATNSSDARPSFSNYGVTTVDLGAPGYAIYSTSPGSSYSSKSGTSMAAPHVAGAAALIKSLNPALTTAQIKSCILANVDPVSSLSGITVTGGRLNVANCIASLTTTNNLIPTMTSNTAPSGTASASSTYSSTTYAPWKAFDGDNVSGSASRWISSSGMPQWIAYKFATPVIASSYYILPETGDCADRAPKNFQLQGSSNGVNWTTLDTQSNITLSLYNSAGLTFSIKNPGSYTYYRLYITAVNGSSVVSIQQIKLFK